MSASGKAMVIGGGIAGAALAIGLVRGGRPVTLIERKQGPHDKVCGEFLSAEAALYLHDLNIDVEALGAVPIESVRLFSSQLVAQARLPFRAFSLSRRVLDEALLQRASQLGAEIRRGVGVQSLAHRNDGWAAQLDSHERMTGADVFLATGKHDLRGWKRPQGRQADLIAFKMHWRLSPAETAALDRHVELFLFPGGYAGLEPVEDGIANLCLVIRKSRFERIGKNWEALLSNLRSHCPQLERRLAGATACWERPLAISSIPYGYVRAHSDGAWFLGDQAAVIPSFSGDGISIALHSARSAALCYLEGGTAERYQSRLAHDIAGQVRFATMISRALVHPLGQTIMALALRVRPSLMRAVAGATRISPRALGRVR